MGDSEALMQSMLLACVVLLVVPTSVLGATVVWYLRSRRHPQAFGEEASGQPEAPV